MIFFIKCNYPYILSLFSLHSKLLVIIGGFRGGAKGAAAPLFQNIFVWLHPFYPSWKSFYKMPFNSFFQNVNITLLCITNTPTMLYAASPEKWSFHSREGEGGGLGPLFLNFLDPPLDCMDHLSETGDKQLLLSYWNLKSLIKIFLKEFIHTKFTYFCGGSSRTG